MPDYHPEIFLKDLNGKIYTLQLSLTFPSDERLTGVRIVPVRYNNELSQTHPQTIILYVTDSEVKFKPHIFELDVPYDGIIEDKIAIQVAEKSEDGDQIRFETVLDIPRYEYTLTPESIPKVERNPRSREKRPNRRYRYD